MEKKSFSPPVPDGDPSPAAEAGAGRPGDYPTGRDKLSMVGMYFLLSVVVGLIFAPFGADKGGLPLFLMYVTTFALLIGFSLYLKKQKTGDLKGILHFSIRGFSPGIILWGVILMLAVGVVIEPLTDLFPDEWMRQLNRTISGTGGWAMVTAVVAAPVCEEVFFRGILQDGLTRKYGGWQGILLASFIFGAIHLVPQQVVGGTLIGVVIGYVYYRTRSLLSAIVLHAINNSLALFSMLLMEDESVTVRQAVGSDTVYYVIYAVAVLLVALSLVRVVTLVRQGKFRRGETDAEWKRL